MESTVYTNCAARAAAGTLALTLILGRIRSIRFTDDSGPRATKWNAVPAAPGDILNLRDIEQGLENFKLSRRNSFAGRCTNWWW